MTMLEIELLGVGSYRAGPSEDRHTLSSACGEVLARMVLHRGRPLRRDLIAQDLWSDVAWDVRRQRLNKALYRLRQQIEPDVRNPIYILAPSKSELVFDTAADYWLDIEDFEQRAHRGVAADGIDETTELSQAIELYSGYLCQSLEGYWVDMERRRLASLYVTALVLLARRKLQRGDHSEAVRLARLALVHEPLREETYRLVMRALSALGDRSGALLAFEECKRVLAEELDITPLPETTRLAVAIGKGLPDPFGELAVSKAVTTLQRTRTDLLAMIDDIDDALGSITS